MPKRKGKGAAAQSEDEDQDYESLVLQVCSRQRVQPQQGSGLPSSRGSSAAASAGGSGAASARKGTRAADRLDMAAVAQRLQEGGATSPRKHNALISSTASHAATSVGSSRVGSRRKRSQSAGGQGVAVGRKRLSKVLEAGFADENRNEGLSTTDDEAPSALPQGKSPAAGPGKHSKKIGQLLASSDEEPLDDDSDDDASRQPLAGAARKVCPFPWVRCDCVLASFHVLHGLCHVLHGFAMYYEACVMYHKYMAYCIPRTLCCM